VRAHGPPRFQHEGIAIFRRCRCRYVANQPHQSIIFFLTQSSFRAGKGAGMAYGVEFARAGALAQTIYVWPSQGLMSRSWSWPAAWHVAFQDAASRLGLAVALYGLDGRRFTRRLVEMRLSVGSVAFRVRQRGASVFVTVSDFTAPVSPLPDGPDGTRQPGAVDGLVLGLHGSDRGVYLVVFYGQMPPVPVGASSPAGRPTAGHKREWQVSSDAGVSRTRPGQPNETWRRAAKTAESTAASTGKCADSRRMEAAGKASSGRRARSSAKQGRETWSAIVWRTHAGSLAILPLRKNARPQRWPDMDGALIAHAPSRLLH
jgi:hypothetical protein